MIVLFSFIGELPVYVLDTIQQVRFFFDGKIVLITNECQKYKQQLAKLNVDIIPYIKVKDEEFLRTCKKSHIKRVNGLRGREELFLRSFERFVLAKNWMIQENATDVLFLELDNLIYADPRLWESHLKSSPISLMYDNFGRVSTGLCFLRDCKGVEKLVDNLIRYIKTNKGSCPSEMGANAQLVERYPHLCQILPTHCQIDNKFPQLSENFRNYNSMFDAAAIGIFLFGLDPFHTRGKIKLGQRNKWSYIDYTKFKFKWKTQNHLRCPFAEIDGVNIKINNLHIHSKNLKPAMSNIQ